RIARRVDIDFPAPRTRLPDGVDRILQDVDEDLLDLDTICENGQGVRAEMEPQRDVLLLHFAEQPPGGVPHQLAQVGRIPSRLAALDEFPQAMHDLAGTYGLPCGTLEELDQLCRLPPAA